MTASTTSRMSTIAATASTPLSRPRPNNTPPLSHSGVLYNRTTGPTPGATRAPPHPPPPLATSDIPFFSYQNHPRALLPLPAYNDSGSMEFFTVLGELS